MSIPDQKLIENTIVESWHQLQKLENIGESGDERDLYYLLDYLSFSVHRQYASIPCKSGCSACCQTFGLPRVTALEWVALHRHLIHDVPRETRQLILKQNAERFTVQIPELLDEMARVALGPVEIEGYEGPRPSISLGEIACPALINHRCSVYDGRPAICRAYGYFSIRRKGEETTLFTCRMAAEAVLNDLEEKGIKNWALPVWNNFGKRLYEMNESLKVVALLPLWLFAHQAGDDLSPEINLNPDFEALRDRCVAGETNNG